MRVPSRQTVGYVATLAGALILAVVAGYTPFGKQVDTDAYDWMFRLFPPRPWTPDSAVLAIDEATLIDMGGVGGLRRITAAALEKLAAAGPKVVAIDLTLAEPGDPADDVRLEAAMKKAHNLVLAAEMFPGGEGWQEPLPRFRQWAAAVGHVHAAPDELDGINRQIPLEKAAARKRYWALALEAFRLSRGAVQILESPDELWVGHLRIPAQRSQSRALLVQYPPGGDDGGTAIPRVSVKQLIVDPQRAEVFRGKTVFVGVTAQSAARDRLMTPFSSNRPMPGVEIHASAFETLVQGRFATAVPDVAALAVSIALVASAGVIFALLSGWMAYVAGGILLLAAHAMPFALFTQGSVFPFTAPASAAWLSVVSAAAYQYFVVRRQLRHAEAERSRYQQAVHFVTHEMKTPLTAIQGSSELMQRYSLNEEKRRQMTDLIHSESRRLARMVETFLNVERLSAGQMELKHESFGSAELVAACIERARPLAERKLMRLILEPVPDETLTGDRELMEYAVYNLINNAVKYSPPETAVIVFGRMNGAELRLSVRDQGIGMDEKEVRNIFRKFYRTKSAVASGESGTGIGLSIVEQIVTHHGGRIEVTSAPGKGSCFTLVLPAQSPAGTVEK